MLPVASTLPICRVTGAVVGGSGVPVGGGGGGDKIANGGGGGDCADAEPQRGVTFTVSTAAAAKTQV